MDYENYSHRFAETILSQGKYKTVFDELDSVIKQISEQQLINEAKSFFNAHPKRKSISDIINKLIRSGLEMKNWAAETKIFKDPDYSKDKSSAWRLDFSKAPISVEVAFNHGGSIAHNLIKPVLASELNHIQKDVQTELGVIITATNKLKKVGGFDGAIGSYEDYKRYLIPYQNILPIPILLIGLKAPKTFKVFVRKSVAAGENKAEVHLIK